MTSQQSTFDLISKLEGFKTKAYLDSKGIPTIGIGFTLGVKIGDTMTKAQIQDRFLKEVKEREYILSGIDLTQNQFDSLLSLVYNIGLGAFSRSTIFKMVKANPNTPQIRDEFMKWSKPNLSRRRKIEADNYFA